MVAVLLASCEVGYRLGLAREGAPDSLRTLMSRIGGAMLGLPGLLLGSALSMATARWDARRDLIVQEANGPGTANAVLAALIGSANEVIDLHEERIDSVQNHLPAALFALLVCLAALAVGFLAWSFGASSHRGRTPVVLLAVLIGAILLLIMDVNRPQRGFIAVGVAPLERTTESVTAVAE
jgi:hypothetical protein